MHKLYYSSKERTRAQPHVDYSRIVKRRATILNFGVHWKRINMPYVHILDFHFVITLEISEHRPIVVTVSGFIVIIVIDSQHLTGLSVLAD